MTSGRIGGRNKRPQTLRHLRCQRGGDRDKVEFRAPVVDWHLLAFAHVVGIAVALVAKLFQSEATIHQHAFYTHV